MTPGPISGSSPSQTLVIETTENTGGEADGMPIYQDLYGVTIDANKDTGNPFTLDWSYGLDTDDALPAQIYFSITRLT